MSRWRIYRKRVVDVLRGARNNRVLLLLADAGYGKSIALQQFLQSDDEPYAYYRVQPETTTLFGFLRGLTESLEPFIPGAHLSLTMAHERAMQSPTPFVELANWFGEHLRDATVRIVIDDLRNASADAVVDFLLRATARTPPAVKWMIAARPSRLPSSPWHSRGDVDLPIDESVLAFTPEELEELARHCGLPISSSRLGEIFGMTEGWPSASALALVRPDAVAIRNYKVPRDELYGTLAQAIFERHDAATRELLLQTAVYSRLHADVLRADGRAELFAALLEKDGIYIDDLGGGTYAYDGLLRAYLLQKLEASPEVEASAFLRAAAACERTGRWEEALGYHRKANAVDAIARILTERGFALLDTGALEIVESSIDALAAAGLDRDPQILGLRAILDSERARFDAAEAWFTLAIEQITDERLRLNVVNRYALDLLRRGRVDCIELLEASVESAEKTQHELYPLLCATLATAYVLVDRFEDARKLISQVIPLLRPPLPEALRARAFHQAAYVALRCRDIYNAERYALKALDIALANNLYYIATRAASILYEIAYLWEVNSSQALAYIEKVASFALRSGEALAREWALIGAYYIQAERGNAEMMAEIERSFDVADVLQMKDETTTALLPGRALRATWSGDFQGACRLLVQSSDGQLSPDQRALRAAEVALYAAAAGLRQPALEALHSARDALPGAGDNKPAIQALAYALLAASVLGEREMRNALRADDRLEGLPRPLAALLRTVDVLDETVRGRSNHHKLLEAMGDLHTFNLAGIAKMFEALPGIPSLVGG
jgi:ATP/maltotriose-dependent transcriptional regulator MalT